MKTSSRFLTVLLLPALVSLPAGSAWSQQREALPEIKSARVVERGSHHAKWETVQEVADPISGETISVTNSYVQLETGLHYQDERGEWQESSEEIEVQPGAAVARRGPHQVRWAANLNTYGAIEFWTPEGEAIRSHVLGLAYFDPATGAHVMIGEVQDSVGAVAGNQVIYEDAFDGVSADLHYTYTKGGFVQDVIVREKLPDPALWGFDPATVQVQVLTEFVALPEPLKELARVSSETLTSTNASPGRFAAAYQADQALNFGSMAMTEGRAFGVADEAQERAVPVHKRLQLFEGGRNILVETLDYVVMEPELEALPENSKPTASLDRKASGQHTAGLRIAPPAPTRQWAAIEPPANEEKESPLMARVELPTGRNGYVIDYNLSGTTNNLTLQGDTTYYITGLVTATNITTIEGGTVVKFANTNNAELKIKGTIRCLAAPYRPAIFTAKDDNSVGSTISGSTGSPSGYYAIRALNIDDNTSDLRHIHIRFARQGVYYGSGSAYPHFLTHVQMVQVGEGVVSLSPVFFVRNGLFHGVITNFTTSVSGVTGHIEHLTSHLANRLNGYSSLTLNVTNSLLVRLTNSSSYNNGGGNAVSSDSGIFASAGAATHYLPVSSPHRDVGVTGISHALLRDFPSMTTETPLFLTNVTLVANTVLSPVALRDTDVPDRGYHYPALDFLIDTLKVSNSTLTLTNGVALASIGLNGIWLADSAKLVSEGGPTRHNIISEYNAVHEQPQLLTAGTAGMLINPYYISAPSTSASFRFTSLYADHGSMLFYYSVGGTYQYKISAATFRDCEVAGGYAAFYGSSGVGTLAFDNVLFNRFSFEFNGEPTVNCYNATFHGGSIYAWSSGTYGIVFKDNLFNKTDILDLGTLTHNYNGYANGSSRLTPNQANDRVISSLAFEHGPLGRHYLPAGSILLNNGSRNATAAGLYHHTTLVDQTRETNSVVDIGYHYVAVNPVSVELAKATMAPTGSSTCCSWPASNTTNNLTADPGWVNNSYTFANEYLRIDLGSSKTVDRVGYIPRQYTSMTTDWTGNNNGAYRDYKIYVTDSTSTNPANWGAPVFTGRFNWPNGQERREVEFAPKAGRYVYYYRVNAYGWYGPTDPNQYQNGWPGYAGANEVWIWENRGTASKPLDSDLDLLADYWEDANGNGVWDIGSGEFSYLDPDSDYDGILDGEEVSQGISALHASRVLPRRLAAFPFDNATWHGDRNQTPLYAVGLTRPLNWSGTSVKLASTSGNHIRYRTVETDGSPNLNMRNGTVLFWYRPTWTSKNLGAGVPGGAYGRLFNVGEWSNSPYTYGGIWSLVMHPDGDKISFVTQTNGASASPIPYTTVTGGFTNGHWYQFALTYTPTNSVLYRNGVRVATGSGVTLWPNPTVRGYGFSIGSDLAGTQVCPGEYDGLETYNYPLADQQVVHKFKEGLAVDVDGDLLPDLVEAGLGTATQAGGGVVDSRDSDGDGMWDGFEFKHGLSLLSNDSAQDADGDGLSNLAEFNAGRNPRFAEPPEAGEAPPPYLMAPSQGDLINIDFTTIDTTSQSAVDARANVVKGPAAIGHTPSGSAADRWNFISHKNATTMRVEGFPLLTAANKPSGAKFYAMAGPFRVDAPYLPGYQYGHVGVTCVPYWRLGRTYNCLLTAAWYADRDDQFIERYQLSSGFCLFDHHLRQNHMLGSMWSCWITSHPMVLGNSQHVLWRYFTQSYNVGLLPMFGWRDLGGNPVMYLDALDDPGVNLINLNPAGDGGLTMYQDFLLSYLDRSQARTDMTTANLLNPKYPTTFKFGGLTPGRYLVYIYGHTDQAGGKAVISHNGVSAQTGNRWNSTTWEEGSQLVRFEVELGLVHAYGNQGTDPELTAAPWAGIRDDYWNVVGNPVVRRLNSIPQPVTSDPVTETELTFQFGSAAVLNGIQIVRAQPPGQVTGFTVVPRSGAAAMWWTRVSGAESYVIERSDSSTGEFHRVGTTASRAFADSGLTPGLPYYYRIVPLLGSWRGKPSEVKSVTPAALLGNQPPQLSSIKRLELPQLAGGKFVIPFAKLLESTDVSDAEEDPISFRIVGLTSGTLKVGTPPASPTTVVPTASNPVAFRPGSIVEWTPDAGTVPPETGTAALVVRAFDGYSASISSVPVRIRKKATTRVLGWGANVNGGLGDGVVFDYRGSWRTYVGTDGLLHGEKRDFHWPEDAPEIQREPKTALNTDYALKVAANNWSDAGVRMAARADGTLWAWGLGNHYGLFGDGELGAFNPSPSTLDAFTKIYATPVQVRGSDNQGALVQLTDVVDVSVAQHALALKNDGTVWTWGQGASGQLGYKVFIPTSPHVQELPSEYLELAGIKAMLSTWGCTTTPRKVDGLEEIIAVVSDNNASLALTRDGRVFWWGTIHLNRPNYGGTAFRYFLQDAITSANDLPNRIALFDAGSPAVQIAAADGHYLVVRRDGSVDEFGYVPRLRIGQTHGENYFVTEPFFLAPNAQSPAATKVPGLSDVVSVATSGHYSLAVLRDGTVKQWGILFAGSPSRQKQYPTPTLVAGLQDIVQVSVRHDTALALDKHGRVWSWGSESSGRLGRVDTNDPHTPGLITGIEQAESITTAPGNAFAVATPSTRPLGFRGTGRDTEIFLEWHRVPGAQKYQVYERSPDQYDILIGSTGATSFTIKNRENFQRYYYKVQGVIDGVAQDFSDQIDVVPVPPPTIAPDWAINSGQGTVRAVVPGCREIMVKWEHIQEEVQVANGFTVQAYRLYRQHMSNPSGPWSDYYPLAVVLPGEMPFIDRAVQSNMSYQYKVAASTTAGDGPMSGPSDIATTSSPEPGACHAAPINFAASLDGLSPNYTQKINLSWGRHSSYPTGVTISYRVKIKYSPSGPFRWISDVGSSSSNVSFTTEALMAGHQYWFTVSAVINGFETPDATPITLTPIATAGTGQPLPAEITKIVAGNAQVLIEWDDSDGNVDYYQVLRSSTQNGTYAAIPNSTSFTREGRFWDTAVVNGSTYWYKIRAIRQIPSLEATSTTAKSATLALAASPITMNALSVTVFDQMLYISWIAPTETITGLHYWLQRKETGQDDKEYATIAGPAPYGNGFLDVGLINGTSYTYRLTAYNDLRRVQLSASATPSGAGGMSLTAVSGSGHVQLNWSHVGATRFNVYRGTSQGGTFAQIASVPYTTAASQSSSYVDLAVNNGTEYWYFVAAEGHGSLANLQGTIQGMSTLMRQSPKVAATPLATGRPAPVVDFSVRQSNDRIVFSWSAVESATTYTIYPVVNGQQGTALFTTDDITGGYTPNPAPANGTVLTYRIVAFNAAQTSLSRDASMKYTTVNNDSSGGFVAIVSPTHGQIMYTPTNLVVSAGVTVTDTVQVDFFASSGSSYLFLGSATQPPYQVLWRDVPKGPTANQWKLSAVAYTRNGTSKATDPILDTQSPTVTVNLAPELQSFKTSVTDLEIPTPGLPLTVARSYDSREANSGSTSVNTELGKGWRPLWNDSSVTLSEPLGQSWQAVPYTVFSGWGVAETKSHIVTVRLPGGEIVRFTPQIDSSYFDLSPSWAALLDGDFLGERAVEMIFVPEDPSAGTLVCEFTGELGLDSGNADWNSRPPVTITMGGYHVLVPNSFTYHSPQGIAFSFVLKSGTASNTWLLTSMSDRNQNAVSYTYDAQGRVTYISHVNGRQINFDYATAGEIRVYDPIELAKPLANRKAVLKYMISSTGGDNFLSRVGHLKDRAAASPDYEWTDYTYGTSGANNDRLTDIFDGRGVRVLKNEYADPPAGGITAPGSLVKQTDASLNTVDFVFDPNSGALQLKRSGDGCPVGGCVTTVNHNDSGGVSGVVDPLNQTGTVVRDGLGRIIEERGPGNTVTRIGYDEWDRPISQTDEAGNTTQVRYNSDDQPYLTIDANGNESVMEYDDFGNLSSSLDSLGNESSQEVALFNLATLQEPGVPNKLLLPSLETQRAYGATYRTHTRYFYTPYGEVKEMVQYATIAIPGSDTSFYKSVATVYEYDENGNRTKETRGACTVDTGGNPTRSGGAIVFNGQKRETRFTYDPRNRLITTMDPLGVETPATNDRVSTTSFEGSGKPAQTVDVMGRTTSMVYDVNGNLIETTYPDGSVSRTYYDDFNRPVYVQDRCATDTSNPSLSTAPATHHTYDQLGRATHIKRVSGLTLEKKEAVAGSEYIRFGSVVHYRMVPPDQATPPRTPPTVLTTTRTVYDAAGRVQYTVSPAGALTENVYDVSGRRTAAKVYPDNYFDPTSTAAITIPGGAAVLTTTYGYDRNGNQLWVVDAGNRRTDYQYDELNRQTLVLLPEWSATDTRPATQFFYDGFGRKTREIDGEGVATEYRYDNLGNLIKVVEDAAGVSPVETKFTYNAFGETASQIDALNRTTTYAYDVLGRRVTRTLPDTLNETVTYSDEPETVGSSIKVLKKVVRDFMARDITYLHDRLDRLTNITPDTADYSTSAEETAAVIEYNKAGQRTRVVQSVGTARTVRYAYDNKGRLRVKDAPEGTLTYDYDAVGNLQKISARKTYTGWVTTAPFVNTFESLTASSPDTTRAEWAYEYDSLGRLKKVNNDGSISDASYTYNNVGAVSTMTYRNGVVTTYQYNPRNWLRGLSTVKGATTLAAFDYDEIWNTYNINSPTYLPASGGAAYYVWDRDEVLSPTGKRRFAHEAINGKARRISYGYDSRDRLLTETITASGSATLLGTAATVNYDTDTANPTTTGYDTVGNRKSRRITAGSLSGVVQYTGDTFDNRDRVEDAAGPDNPVFNQNGNVTGYTGGGATDIYVYDAYDRLISRTRSGVTATFTYDVDGNRVSKTLGGTTTSYLVDDRNPTGYAQVVEERNGTSTTVVYVYGLDLVSQKRGSTTHYYGYDGLGSVRYLTDTAGVVTDTFTYDAFGILVERTGTTVNDYRYTGEQWDGDLGMYYLRARYYRPELGRFWTSDTFEGKQNDPLSLHKYLYAHSNPVNNLDPSGHETLKTKLGKELHKKLGEMFVGKNHAFRFSSRAISTISNELGIRIPDKFVRWLPDLVDISTKEIYEIKPMSAYGLSGVFQLWGYIWAFNEIDRTGGWHPGSSWSPPRFVRLSLGFAFVSPPVGGMIFYDVETIQDIAKKGYRSSRASDQARLQQHLGIATILSTIAKF